MTVSTVLLMKEGSGVNIPDFGKGTASYFAVCNNNSQYTAPCHTVDTILKFLGTYKYD
jgi:hypothetical protein